MRIVAGVDGRMKPFLPWNKSRYSTGRTRSCSYMAWILGCSSLPSWPWQSIFKGTTNSARPSSAAAPCCRLRLPPFGRCAKSSIRPPSFSTAPHGKGRPHRSGHARLQPGDESVCRQRFAPRPAPCNGANLDRERKSSTRHPRSHGCGRPRGCDPSSHVADVAPLQNPVAVTISLGRPLAPHGQRAFDGGTRRLV